MAKFAVILCAIVVINLVHAEMDDLIKISQLCQTQEKATDKDMEAWRNNTKPAPKNAKCVEACIGEKLGMLVNNKLNVSAVEKYIEREYKDQKTITGYKDIVNECKSVTDQDRCEMSEKVQNCLKDGASKRGMKELF